MRQNPIVALVLLLVLGGVAPAAGQRFGQWWWTGKLTGSGRSFQNQIDGRSVSESDQTDLELSFDLNGYLLHPRVGRFRLGLDTRFSSVDGSRSVDTDEAGYRGELSLFPRGPYPLELFVSRQQYDYSGLTEEDSFTLLGAPKTTTLRGARFAVRRGLLRGTRLSYRRTDLEFMNPDTDTEVREDGSLDWAGSTGSLSHHVRLERRIRQFGTVDFATDDLTLTLEERGELVADWRLDLTGFAIQRNVSSTQGERKVDIYRLRSTISHVTTGDNTLRLSHSAAWVRSDGSESRGQSLSARYLWRGSGSWQVGPFVAYSVQRSDRADVDAPQVGVTAGWSRRRRGFDLHLAGTGSYLRLRRMDAATDETRAATALSTQVTVGQGDERRLRRVLDFTASRNELRVSGEPIGELPDLGASIQQAGAVDTVRGRLTLKRSWNKARASGYAEMSRRDSEGSAMVDGAFTSDSLIFNMQIQRSPLTLLGNAGETSLEQTSAASQNVRFVSATALWQPYWFLRLRGYYRQDDRQVLLGPDVDGERAELEIDLQYGMAAMEVILFSTRERAGGGLFRTNRGVRWNVSRRFAGWLPVVSAPQRRGVIR